MRGHRDRARYNQTIAVVIKQLILNYIVDIDTSSVASSPSDCANLLRYLHGQ